MAEEDVHPKDLAPDMDAAAAPEPEPKEEKKDEEKEKPAKKKRVMTEAQLANLAKAREKAAELRKAKADAAKKTAEPVPEMQPDDDEPEPSKEEKLHKFAEEVNAELEQEAAKTEAEPKEPDAPLKPATKRKRKSRWDEFEDGTLKVKEPEKDEKDAPKRRIKPERLSDSAPKPVKVPGRFGAAPSSYAYGDHQQLLLDPARVAYNQQVQHVKRNLVYRNILPF